MTQPSKASPRASRKSPTTELSRSRLRRLSTIDVGFGPRSVVTVSVPIANLRPTNGQVWSKALPVVRDFQRVALPQTPRAAMLSGRRRSIQYPRRKNPKCDQTECRLMAHLRHSESFSECREKPRKRTRRIGRCHPRESGDLGVSGHEVPAFAGMTEGSRG